MTRMSRGLRKRIGELSEVHALLKNLARWHPDDEFIRECYELAWFQLCEAHAALLGSGPKSIL